MAMEDGGGGSHQPCSHSYLNVDPWKAYWRCRQRLPRHAVRALESL